MPDLEIAQLRRRHADLRILDPARVSRLAASLVQEGQRSPVLVVGDVLIDGYQRVHALTELGRDLVSAVRLELDEPDALVLAWRFETGRRKTAIEEAWLPSELLETHGRTQASLARELRRSRGSGRRSGTSLSSAPCRFPMRGVRQVTPESGLDSGATSG